MSNSKDQIVTENQELLDSLLKEIEKEQPDKERTTKQRTAAGKMNKDVSGSSHLVDIDYHDADLDVEENYQQQLRDRMRERMLMRDLDASQQHSALIDTDGLIFPGVIGETTSGYYDPVRPNNYNGPAIIPLQGITNHQNLRYNYHTVPYSRSLRENCISGEAVGAPCTSEEMYLGAGNRMYSVQSSPHKTLPIHVRLNREALGKHPDEDTYRYLYHKKKEFDQHYDVTQPVARYVCEMHSEKPSCPRGRQLHRVPPSDDLQTHRQWNDQARTLRQNRARNLSQPPQRHDCLVPFSTMSSVPYVTHPLHHAEGKAGDKKINIDINLNVTSPRTAGQTAFEMRGKLQSKPYPFGTVNLTLSEDKNGYDEMYRPDITTTSRLPEGYRNYMTQQGPYTDRYDGKENRYKVRPILMQNGVKGPYRIFTITDYKNLQRELQLGSGLDIDIETAEEKKERVAVQQAYGRAIREKNSKEHKLRMSSKF